MLLKSITVDIILFDTNNNMALNNAGKIIKQNNRNNWVCNSYNIHTIYTTFWIY